MNLDSLQHRLLSWCRKVLACCSLCHRYKTELARCNAELQRQIAASAEKERTLRKECEGRMACLEDLRRKNFELEKNERLKTEFLGAMSHELKTPLNSILGFSEMLRDEIVGEVTPRQKDYLNEIFQAGNHLLALINNLLDLSRIEAGKIAFAPEDCELSSLLEESVAPQRQVAQAKRLTLACEIAPALGQMRVDPRRLRQILVNLLSNAVKFTPEGGTITLRARPAARADLPRPPAEEAATYLELAVADTGPGIPHEMQGTLFQPFVMVDNSASRTHGGTGLGLALVQQLSILMGGDVAVDSAPGAGACFTVWLPWHPPLEQVGAQPNAMADAIVVEDDDIAAELIQSQLATDGIKVRRARTAEEGLRLAAERTPDLFTVDILLPGMDGWELLAHLKQDPQLAGVPVVIISIIADSGKGLSLGAAKVLQKPYTYRELEQALNVLDFARTDGKPPVVLVADDDPQALELFTAHLARGNYRVLRAGGGIDALALARAEHPDLIVLDLMMPDMTGFEVVEHLKEDPVTAGIPVLIATAKTITPEDRKALNGHVLRILEKAEFNHGRFINEVRRAMRRHAQ